MPNELRIAAAQFENRSGNKEFNLAAIDALTARAARQGAEVIAFHECSITGYGFARRLSREQLLNRESDPTSLRAEFDGLKGRAWLMQWLPARAHDNGIFAVFSNPIGMDDDQLKNGCSMIVDPFGDIVAECRLLGDDIAIATCSRQKLASSGGHRYREARKPELFGHILGAAHRSKQTVPWMSNPPASE